MPTWMMGVVVPFFFPRHGLDRQFFDLIHRAQSVVDHVRGGLKSETFSVKLGVVETMVSMRCLRSPSEEVEVAW